MLHQALLRRIRAEYLEMPGLRLTLDQARRLCGADRMQCKAVLEALVAARFLCMKADGTYARVAEGEVSRSRPVTGEPVRQLTRRGA
jgi:hypothetical protein